MSEHAGTLRIETEGAVQVLRLNRPTRRNALDLPMTRALHRALLDAEADSAVRAIVLGADGSVFCAGGDLREGERDGAGALAARLELTRQILLLLPRLGKPVVSAVQGAALGGGAGLAIACDLVVAADDVRFGYPGAGTTPIGLLVLAMLRDVMGGRAAFGLISQGLVIDGAAMAGSGLAQHVVAAAEVMPTAMRVAAGWAEIDPATMMAFKALIRKQAG